MHICGQKETKRITSEVGWLFTTPLTIQFGWPLDWLAT
jgi:hypothetical protein